MNILLRPTPVIFTLLSVIVTLGVFSPVNARLDTRSEHVGDWSYPIGVAGRPLGDGFWMRHGFAVENTWFNPGHWHTGEDWYAHTGDTAGANVYAVAAGEVVYVGSNYPGRVVIVEHADDLFSMYGHLDPRVKIKQGQRVDRGELLGTVLKRGDKVPNHLHFEIRTFLTTREVNGASPRYRFRCGRQCPPGPGYWPIRARELPTALGWRNPTHVISRRAGINSGEPTSTRRHVVVAAKPVSARTRLWTTIGRDGTSQKQIGVLKLTPGQRYALIDVRAGPEAPNGTSAQSYQLWYNIELPDGTSGWVQAVIPSTTETGGDGRASSVRFNFVPDQSVN